MLCSNFRACDQCSSRDREAGPETVEMQPTDQNIDSDDHKETDELQYNRH